MFIYIYLMSPYIIIKLHFSSCLKSVHISFLLLLTLTCDKHFSVTIMNKPEERKDGGAADLAFALLLQCVWVDSSTTMFLSSPTGFGVEGQKACFHWWSGWTTMWYILLSIITAVKTRDMDCYWPKYVFVSISFLFHFMKNYGPRIKKPSNLYNLNLISRFYFLFAKIRIICF